MNKIQNKHLRLTFAMAKWDLITSRVFALGDQLKGTQQKYIYFFGSIARSHFFFKVRKSGKFEVRPLQLLSLIAIN